MKNIFEGAKFGDKFRTRDGRCAIYLGWSAFDNEIWCRFVSENKEEFEVLKSNGKARFDTVELDRDIVGRWAEPVDEEKLADLELEATEKRRAWDINHYKEIGIPMPSSFSLSDIDEAYMGGYDAGYRKAMEEIQ